MVSIRHLAIFITLAFVCFPASLPAPAQPHAPSSSLFAQSTAETLTREFPDQKISFLVLDARTGEILATRWDDLTLPIPLGSLTKPFAALAYGEHHGFIYPEYTCRGTASGCWRPHGHGKVDLTSAIAYSCNSYFRRLTADLTASDVAQTAARFGLDPPDHDVSGAQFAGLGSQWKISPLRMAEAYVELLRESRNDSVQQIFDGMAQSGSKGTGAEVDRALRSSRALVKTGTAQCTHSRHAPGDGFTVALFPSDNPRILLMVRVHGVPGAHAARTAGAMLRRIED